MVERKGGSCPLGNSVLSSLAVFIGVGGGGEGRRGAGLYLVVRILASKLSMSLY